jgi:glycosyltransferase involved in cell wall biosynthesis
MKILMQNRRDAFTVSGGDTIQMLKTKEFLEYKYGIKIDISLDLTPNLDEYDIVHLFNVTRVHETYIQFCNAKKQNKRVVVTPIYHSLEAIKQYEENGRYGLIKLLNKFIKSQTMREGIKNLVRATKDLKQLPAIIKQLIIGYEEQQRRVLEDADMLFPIAEEEYRTMKVELGIKNSNYIIVPNAIDFKKNSISDDGQGLVINNKSIKNYVLCVGRIESRKNQLNLIKALRGTNIPVVFVGAINSKHKGYSKEFLKNIDNKQFFYLGKVNHSEMMEIYSKAKVHVLPSWVEVIPLVDIEASYAGCKLVTTKNSYIKEYLGENALYCDPGNLNSIKQLTLQMYNQNSKTNIEDIKTFTWSEVVERVYEGYRRVYNS